jgi:hypothetical protein
MGLREENITNTLLKKGYTKIELKPSFEKLISLYSDEINRMYRKLGGILPVAPIKFGKFDFVCSDFILEFDEEQHFNRYRKMTLESSVYPSNGFDLDQYKKNCYEKEGDCLKKATFGKYWTSPSTEKQFGLSNNNGNLDLNGSARWKQRAYYDFLKDAWAKSENIKLLRFSLYETTEINF